MCWATWELPTCTQVRHTAPFSSLNKHCLLIARLATAEAKALIWVTWELPTCTLDDTRRAIPFCEQQLAIVREIGDRRGEGNALWNMSLALDQLGERAQAIKHAEQALIIREQIEDPNAAKCASNLPSGESKQRRETHFRTGKLSLSVPEHCYTHPQPSRANSLSNQGR
jgi:tetratricopeptide (TPR) repeat protein